MIHPAPEVFSLQTLSSDYLYDVLPRLAMILSLSSTLENARFKPSYFTRVRKMDFKDISLFILTSFPILVTLNGIADMTDEDQRQELKEESCVYRLGIVNAESLHVQLVFQVVEIASAISLNYLPMPVYQRTPRKHGNR
jgi:hypothetical protein